jgi:hypothetical protein
MGPTADLKVAAKRKIPTLLIEHILVSKLIFSPIFCHLPNSMEQSPSEKLILSQLVKKFLIFYGIQRFIIMFKEPATGACPEPDEPSPHFPTLFP